MYLRASGREGQPLSLELSNQPFPNPLPVATITTTSTTTTTTGTDPSPSHSSGVVVSGGGDKGGVVGYGCTESVLVPAASRPLGREELVAAVGSLGDTPFRLFEDTQTGAGDEGSLYPRVVTVDLAPDLFVPAKVRIPLPHTTAFILFVYPPSDTSYQSTIHYPSTHHPLLTTLPFPLVIRRSSRLVGEQ